MPFMPSSSRLVLSGRLLTALVVVALPLYLLHNHLHFWLGWPRPGVAGALAYLQLGAAMLGAAGCLYWAWSRRFLPLDRDAQFYSACSAYVVRAAFWGVLLIGLVDGVISFLRVENLLQAAVGETLAGELGRQRFRGPWVHMPLLGLSLLIALRLRDVSVIWLALLVVLAELLIVICRFVFSYEQVFMGDLVRFWYAALFLFASAYTLMHDAHVRVDVLYAQFSRRTKALTTSLGVLLLGWPVCWTIILQGTANRGASINGPLLGFEISQSGFGMYVKYLMAGFLLVFAVSMALQFASLLLNHLAELDEPDTAGAA